MVETVPEKPEVNGKKAKVYPLDETVEAYKQQNETWNQLPVIVAILGSLGHAYFSKYVQSLGLSSSWYYVVEIVSYIVLVAAVVYTVLPIAKRHGGLAKTYGFSDFKMIYLWVGLGCGLLVSLVDVIETPADGMSGTEYDTPQGFLPVLLFFILGAVLVPIAEEFIFRGVLLRTWAMRYGFWPAALLNSFLFGVLGVLLTSNIMLIIPIFIGEFVLAIVNCWLNRKYDSIIPGIIVHVVCNFWVILLLVAKY